MPFSAASRLEVNVDRLHSEVEETGLVEAVVQYNMKVGASTVLLQVSHVQTVVN